MIQIKPEKSAKLLLLNSHYGKFIEIEHQNFDELNYNGHDDIDEEIEELDEI